MHRCFIGTGQMIILMDWSSVFKPQHTRMALDGLFLSTEISLKKGEKVGEDEEARKITAKVGGRSVV